MIPQRRLGKTGASVSTFGLGGEGVLRTHGREVEAREVIRHALDLGVTYFESARAYAGSEEYLGQALGPDRTGVFLASKSHARRARAAQKHLEESLALLGTDWLDLWFVHDVRTEEDLAALAGPSGALTVFQKAKERGQVRFLGVSGHHDPAILLDALLLFDFDCVLLPVNPAETGPRSFPAVVLPEARRRDLGIVAMKTLCRGLVARVPGFPGAAPFLSYAAQTPGVGVTSVGCDSRAQVDANVRAAAAPLPQGEGGREALEQLVYPLRRELLYYRPPGF